MNKPENYDNTSANGSWAPLPAGGYVCRIVSAKEEANSSGKPVLVLAFDIDEGEHKGRFQREFNADTRAEKRWPSTGLYRQPVELSQSTACNPFFKGLITSIEESNDGWKPVWGDGFCNALKGKLIGFSIGREEYMKKDGSTTWITKARMALSVDRIRTGIEPPEDKPLTGGKAPANDTGFAGGALPF